MSPGSVCKTELRTLFARQPFSGFHCIPTNFLGIHFIPPPTHQEFLETPLCTALIEVLRVEIIQGAKLLINTNETSAGALLANLHWRLELVLLGIYFLL